MQSWSHISSMSFFQFWPGIGSDRRARRKCCTCPRGGHLKNKRYHALIEVLKHIIRLLSGEPLIEKFRGKYGELAKFMFRFYLPIRTPARALEQTSKKNPKRVSPSILLSHARLLVSPGENQIGRQGRCTNGGDYAHPQNQSSTTLGLYLSIVCWC